ncbi:hypothetical protein BH11PSE2_BH11PSE2_21740 [soil metagenome]
MKMKTLTACMLAGAMSAAMIPVIAAQAADKPAAKAPTKSAPFKSPKNIFGQPDLEGTWTNATLTPLERDTKFGAELVMNAKELAAAEGARQDSIAEGNQPTDPKLKVTDLPVDCGGGFRGTNCGYNRGWTDPGDNVMRVHGEPRTSFITSTPNGRIPPLKTGGAAPGRGPAPAPAAGGRPGGARPNPLDNPETRFLAERCLASFGNSAGPVMLPLLYNNNYQINQNKDEVVIDVEMVHDVRHIRLNSTHRTDGVRPWWGDSIGHYDGDTLVVETTNYPRQNAFRGSWENLKVIEKFTRVAKDRVLYQFTVEDPTMWATAWGGEYEFGSSKGQVYEYACHEGNYALEGILAGARAEEADAAKKTASAAPAARP